MAGRELVVQYMRTLGDKELAELFYEATRDRPNSDVSSARRHFVLADVSLEEGQKWHLDVIALHDPAKYAEWAPNSPVCQWGTCEGCGFAVKSWAKHMLCPVCGGAAYGT